MVKFIGIPKTIMALALKLHPLIIVVVYQGGKHVCCSIDPAMAPLRGRLVTEHSAYFRVQLLEGNLW